MQITRELIDHYLVVGICLYLFLPLTRSIIMSIISSLFVIGITLMSSKKE